MKVICIDASGIKHNPLLIEGATYTVFHQESKEKGVAYYLSEIPPQEDEGIVFIYGYYSWHFLPCSEIEEGILEFETMQL